MEDVHNVAGSVAAHSTGNEDGTSWRPVLILIGGGVVCAFQIAKMAPAVPAMRDDIGLGLIAAGWLLSTINLIGAATGIFAGAVADYAGHRRVVVLGLTLLAIAGAIGSVARDLDTLLATRIVEGLGFLAVMVSIPPMIIRTTGERAARLALAIWGAWLPIGSAIMIFVSPAILAPFGWRGLWAANVLVVVLYGVVFARSTRHLGAPRRGRSKARNLGAVLRQVFHSSVSVVRAPGPLALAGCFAAYTMSYNAVFGFLPTFFFDSMGATISAAAFMTAFASVTNVGGNVIAGVLRQRNVPRWALILLGSMAMGVATIGLYDGALSSSTRYAMCLVFALFGGFIPASVFGAVPILAPRSTLVGTTNGLVAQGSNIGILFGSPVLAAVVTATGGWEAAPYLTVVYAGIGVLLALYIGRRERRLER